MDAQYFDHTKKGFELPGSLLSRSGALASNDTPWQFTRRNIATKIEKDAYGQDCDHALCRCDAQSVVREIRITDEAKQTFEKRCNRTLRNLHAFSKNMGGNENPLTKWDEARNAALFHMSMAERLGFHVVRTRLLASFS